jgi:hypothetical protein
MAWDRLKYVAGTKNSIQPTRLVTPILIKNNFLLRGFEGYSINMKDLLLKI